MTPIWFFFLCVELLDFGFAIEFPFSLNKLFSSNLQIQFIFSDKISCSGESMWNTVQVCHTFTTLNKIANSLHSVQFTLNWMSWPYDWVYVMYTNKTNVCTVFITVNKPSHSFSSSSTVNTISCSNFEILIKYFCA